MITSKHIKYNEKMLIPVYDNAKSYYKKAVIRDYKNGDVAYKKELLSYDTLVCTIENGTYHLNHDIREDLLLSRTTVRHIRDFLYQNKGMLNSDITLYGKKDILKYEGR